MAGTIAIVAALSFAPPLLWLWYFYRQDRREREPLGFVAKLFFLGLASVAPAVLLTLAIQHQVEYWMPYGPVRVLLGYAAVGVVEEICKFLCVAPAVWRSKHFNEPMDGIVYMVTGALGFSALENVFYLTDELGKHGLSAMILLAAVRAVVSCFAHASFGAIAGYWLGRAKFARRGRGRLIGWGLFLAALMHAAFNFSRDIDTLWGYMPLALAAAFMLVWRNLNRVMIDQALQASPFKDDDRPAARWRWRSVNVIATLLILAALGWGATRINTIDTYQVPEYSFAISYPHSWKPKEELRHAYNIGEADELVLEGPPYRDAVPRVRVAIIPIQAGDKDKPLATLAKESFTRDQGNPDIRNLRWVSAIHGTVARRPALLVTAAWGMPTRAPGEPERVEPMQSLMAYVRAERTLYVVKCHAPAAQYEWYHPLFQRILRTVRLGALDKTKSRRSASNMVKYKN